MRIFSKKTENVYTDSEGNNIVKYTGRKLGFFLENEWLYSDHTGQYIDHDWNLAVLLQRNKLSIR